LFKKKIYYLNILKQSAIKVCLIVITMSLWQCLCAQRSLSAQAQNAIALFNEKKYSEANNQFKILVEKYPKDWLYQYYLGASMVEINQSLPEAIELLKLASIKLEEPWPEYYIGLAYFHQYKFEDAIQTFHSLKNKFKRGQLKELKIDETIERINAAKSFYKKYIEVGVFKKQTLQIDSLNFYVAKTKSFIIKKLPINGDSAIVILKIGDDFIPGERYFFSAKQKGKNDFDIFCCRFELDSIWSAPEFLVSVNSEKDEINPYFDYNEQLLYFSSNREAAPGGYNIFKSGSDSNSGRLEVPSLMPFPINSLLDDLLFLTSPSQAILCSNREVISKKAILYTISPFQETDLLYVSGNDKLETLNNLNINLQAKPVEPENKKEELKTVLLPDTVKMTDELELVSMVLMAQKKVDSVMLTIQKLKDDLVNTDDKDLRNKIFAVLRKQEKLAGLMQKDIEEYYNQLAHADSTKNNDQNNNVKSNTSVTEFELKDGSSYSAKNPFIENYKLPEGIIYRIQLGIFSKPVGFDFFGGLQPISTEILQNGKLIKYYVGVFNRFSEADSSLSKVKALGFKEAFITSYLNSQKIPVERAKDLEMSY
jgi:hypothetical protein